MLTKKICLNVLFFCNKQLRHIAVTVVTLLFKNTGLDFVNLHRLKTDFFF